MQASGGLRCLFAEQCIFSQAVQKSHCSTRLTACIDILLHMYDGQALMCCKTSDGVIKVLYSNSCLVPGLGYFNKYLQHMKIVPNLCLILLFILTYEFRFSLIRFLNVVEEYFTWMSRVSESRVLPG